MLQDLSLDLALKEAGPGPLDQTGKMIWKGFLRRLHVLGALQAFGLIGPDHDGDRKSRKGLWYAHEKGMIHRMLLSGGAHFFAKHGEDMGPDDCQTWLANQYIEEQAVWRDIEGERETIEPETEALLEDARRTKIEALAIEERFYENLRESMKSSHKKRKEDIEMAFVDQQEVILSRKRHEDEKWTAAQQLR